MAKRMAANKRALFNRDMYPEVTFCERCFCHHNVQPCPDYGKEPSEPTWEMVDMLGTWRKIAKQEDNDARDL